MESTKSIVIVDDNESLAVLLKDNLSREPRFDVLGIAKDGEEGLRMIESLKPDIIILDMVMPKADGLTVLEKLEGGYGPDIIILSAIGHDIITKRAMSLGAMYYIIKPFEIGSFINRMNQLFHGDVIDEPEYKKLKYNIRLDDHIANELNALGVPLHVKGYHYLKHAVQVVALKDNSVIKITKDVYPEIAGANDTNPSSVERAIRHAIDLTLSRGSIDYIQAYFKHELFNNKITNKEFILGIADIVRHK